MNTEIIKKCTGDNGTLCLVCGVKCYFYVTVNIAMWSIKNLKSHCKKNNFCDILWLWQIRNTNWVVSLNAWSAVKNSVYWLILYSAVPRTSLYFWHWSFLWIMLELTFHLAIQMTTLLSQARRNAESKFFMNVQLLVFWATLITQIPCRAEALCRGCSLLARPVSSM